MAILLGETMRCRDRAGILRRIPLPILLLAAAVAGLPGCTHPAGREPVEPVIVGEVEVPEPEWTIRRADYEKVLKGGLQDVMRWYFVKPSYDGNTFVGYQVAEVMKEELRMGPLKPGDVIVSINEQPVERPEHALAIWRGLWGKKKLKMHILRAGKPRRYEIPIVGE